VRRQWVRPYLGCYLSLAEDDYCGIPENNPLPRHLTTREEEFFEIGTISFKHLATLMRQGVEGRLDDVVLVEVESVGAGVSKPSCLTCLK
jgi:hypothetical protein